MAKSIKIRARMKGGTCEVKALIKHVMETGLRKDKKTGKVIPAHFIQEVNCEHNGKTVMSANWGTAVSANPYLSFSFSGAKKGDKFKLSWKDNMGNSDAADSVIK
ncbi:thiosulfate oxidation carrier complex protein SoxZ [Sedimenticola sp.]|uniref:thiosulfate oxidation carrier complex protein SoxZ n=1 Tax=Sedimenticola sp. TaxID=1940285 RepID=UPI003D0ED43E